MSRRLRLLAIVSLIGIVVLALWAVRLRSARRSTQESLQDTMRSAVTNPVKFAKNRFTGGVGAILLADPATGVPRIQGIVPGSPAEKAGLQQGDQILQVNGVPATGQNLAQVVDSMRGFAAGSVTLTVRRGGSTNLQFVIHRSSWKNLGITQ